MGSADVQRFDADVDVERGDRVGLRVTPGSAVGVRDGVPGATIERWLPPLTGAPVRPAERGAGTGFDHELLLRVGLLPGGQPASPPQVTGSAAERLPAGRVRARRTSTLHGRPVEFAIVRLGSTFALDRVRGQAAGRSDRRSRDAPARDDRPLPRRRLEPDPDRDRPLLRQRRQRPRGPARLCGNRRAGSRSSAELPPGTWSPDSGSSGCSGAVRGPRSTRRRRSASTGTSR